MGILRDFITKYIVFEKLFLPVGVPEGCAQQGGSICLEPGCLFRAIKKPHIFRCGAQSVKNLVEFRRRNGEIK